MRLFKEPKGYATQANAERKLMKVLNVGSRDELDRRCNYLIAVNDEGRFLPVVSQLHGYDHMRACLIYEGVCVV